MSLTSSPSYLLIKCPYHLNLASLIFSAMSTTSHLLISSLHNVSDQLSFISSYYVSIPSQPCFLIFSAMSTTPHLLISSFHDVSDQLFILKFLLVEVTALPNLRCCAGIIHEEDLPYARLAWKDFTMHY